MNSFFDFSRSQLRFLAAFTLIATVAAVYLLLYSWLAPAPYSGLPEVRQASALTETPVSESTHDLVIDPNTAPIDSLELLPGIGPVKAERIIRFRQTQRFQTIEDLLEVKGIGPRTLESLAPHVRIASDD